MFAKIGLLKNFAIFTGKQLCCSLFLIKLQVYKPVTLIKKYPKTGVFLWILWNFLEHLFLRKTSGGCFWSDKDFILKTMNEFFYHSFLWVIKEVYLKLDTFLNTFDSRILFLYFTDTFVWICFLFAEFVVLRHNRILY